MKSSSTSEHVDLLPHGGRVKAAAARFSIPPENWLDLSTGINPDGWPVPQLPASVWTQLPEDDDDLENIASRFYGAKYLLPVAGTQAAIQALPRLRKPARVAVLHPGYAEHAHAWRLHHHHVSDVSVEQIGNAPDHADVLIIIHPNNPTGTVFTPELLLDWHARLAARNGWLIVDEAFIDVTPESSLAAWTDRPGLIVLRSLGKFFGLAGARAGFVCAHPALLRQLQGLLGPWTVSTPARWVAARALQDTRWHEDTRCKLRTAADRLEALLTRHRLTLSGSCAFFQWVITRDAGDWYHALASRGILVRQLTDPPGLRFGLPAQDTDWQRLDDALTQIQRKFHDLGSGTA